MSGWRTGGARITRFRAPLALLGAIAALATAACGSGTAGRHQADARWAPTSAEARPFSAQLWTFYRYSGREAQGAGVLDRAEEVVEAGCMRHAGFSYWPVPVEPTGETPLDGLATAPGPSPPSEAAALRLASEDGFGIAERVGRLPAAAERNSRYVAGLSPRARHRYMRAFFGNRGQSVRVTFPDGSVDQGPAGGCLGEAARTVYGSAARDDFRLNAVVDVERLVEQRVVATAAVRAATTAWRGCLRARSGHRFATPSSLVEWVAQQYGASEPSRASHRLEIRYAKLSTLCSYASGLATRQAAATWGVLTHMPALWYRTLTEVQRWDEAAIPRAHAILAAARVHRDVSGVGG